MKKVLLLLVASSLLFSNCATILNGKYQKIPINKQNGDEILIDGEKPEMKKGAYLFERDLKPKQITIKSEGYKDEHLVIMQYKKSPLHIISGVPFGIFLYPPLYDKGVKSWNYTNEVINYEKTPAITEKTDEAKEIMVNKVSVKLEKNSVKNRYFPTYKNYIRKDDKISAKASDIEEEIELENTVFSSVLNDLLKEKGYIDTTGNVLTRSYSNNLLLNAKIKDYTIHHIANRYYTKYGGMIYIDLEIDWEILDFYKKPIYTQTTKSSSGQFAITDYEKKERILRSTMRDVMEAGLIEFFKSDKVNFYLNDTTEREKENSFDEIIIARSSENVSDLSESIKSTLTIKSKDGFGSGFIIS